VCVLCSHQVKNQLDSDLEVLGKAESGGGDMRVLGVVKKDQTFPLPIDVLENYTFYVRPAGFGWVELEGRSKGREGCGLWI